MADTPGYSVGAALLFGSADPFDFLGLIIPVVVTAPTTDTTAPQVNNFVPPPGAIGRHKAIQFDVSDETFLTGIVIMALYAADDPSQKRPYDVVYDSNGFADYYKDDSSFAELAVHRYRFTVLKYGGWPSPPRIVAFATDGRVAG